jgi:zinc transporter
VQNASANQWVLNESGLSDQVAHALLAGETRPRAIAEENGMLIILRGVNTNAGAEPEDMVSVRIWIDEHRIISSRRRRLMSVQDVRGALEQGVGPKTPGEFLVMVVERLASRIETMVGGIEDQIDSIEDRLGDSDVRKLQSALSALRRKAAAIRRYLAPQRDALSRIRGKTPILTAQEVYDLEEQSDLTMRHIEELDLARERALVTQEELTNRLAQEQNSRLYVLSIVAAIFLPLSFVTGLLGMNVAGLPGTEVPSAFMISLGGMTLLGAALVGFFRWKRWI